MTKKELGNANNEKIEDLNLVALRKYACPKINSQNDWYLKCVECSGLDGCRAGKRAVELLELNTKPEKSQIEKFNDRLDKKESRSQKFVEALKTDDPAGYLIKHGYFQLRWRANDALKKWKMNHQNDNSSSSEKPKGDPYLTIKENARARAEKIFDGCTDEETLARRILEENPTIKDSSVTAKLYDWRKRYPDLCEKHPEVDKLIKTIGTRPIGKPFTEVIDTLFEKKDDEVSIEDFLKETPETSETATDVNVKTVEEAKTKLQKVLQEQQEKPNFENPKVVDGRTQKFGDIPDLKPANVPTDQEVLLRCFSEKRRAFKAAILIIEEDIDKLRKALCEAETRKTEVYYKLKTLDASAEMFGLAPIKTDEVATKTGDMMGT